ncbi:hypothetical protein E4U42_001305 [Claviceps africana]|uniref:Uncharacterized protein n=1 Tax=Claviceps africana TaxID=83212 RepID=A0A8K0NK57_9HYPO|nr:hypothetical protein E4U42_001305 [Claviceps africana]
MTSWDTFTAFNGKLTSSFLKPSLDAHGQPDYAATVSSFWQWIRDLRQAPGEHGIPPARVDDVERLLDGFFPPTPPDAPMYPTRISSDVGHSESPRVMKPIEVAFAPGKNPMLVTDAPNALGYIFSVQRAAASGDDVGAGFDEYMLPLTVCYAWALHLAFLVPSSAPTLTNVPAEANLVYVPSRVDDTSSSSAPVPVFCLGATWSGADPADAHGAARRSEDEAEMDRWRRNKMVDPVLAGHPHPAVPRSTFGPSVRRTAARRLNEYILGGRDNDDSATPFLRPLFSPSVLGIPGFPSPAGLSEYIQAMSILMTTEGVIFPPVDPENLISHTTLSPVLMDHLYTLVDTLHDPVEDPVSLVRNVQALVRFYLTPHVLDPVSLKDVPLGPKTKAVVENLATLAPPLLLAPMQQKLRSLRHHLENSYESSDAADHKIEARFHMDNNTSFTRSAELLPIFALGQQAKPTPAVQGVNIFSRPLGQAIWRGAFQDAFSAPLLDKATRQQVQGGEYRDPVLGPPGAEGGALVQLVRGDTEGGMGPYARDAKAACPETMALFAV